MDRASSQDKFRHGASGVLVTLNAPAIGADDTVLTPSSITNIPTKTAVDITINRVDSSGKKTPEMMERMIGVVSNGNIVSLLRGQDNTSAKPHAVGSVIEMIPTGKWSQDLIDGLLVSHNQDGTIRNNVITNSNLATGAGQPGGSWTPWTPSFSNLNVGNGVLTARYSQIGKFKIFRLSFVFGSTSSVAGTPVSFTLPSTAASSGLNVGFMNTKFRDTGAANYYGVSTVDPGYSTVGIYVTKTDGLYSTDAAMSPTVPYTFTNTDEISCHGWYEEV